MNLLKCASVLLGCMLAARLPAEERLVYALTHSAAGERTTEVFSLSPEGQAPSILFSDAASPVQLAFLPRSGLASLQMAVAGNRMFAPGTERPSRSGARGTAIYEFSLDGPGRYRKILDLPAGERVDQLIVDRGGTKLAYLSLSANNLTVFVHDVATGNLQHRLIMSKIAGGCTIDSLGWLPDDKTLFFTLGEGPEAFMSDADYKRIGTWVIGEDGTGPTRVSPPLGVLQKPGYRFISTYPPVMLGVVNGQYLFRLPLDKISGRTHEFNTLLVLADPHSEVKTEITLKQPQGLYWFLASTSGRHIAYTEQGPSRFVGKEHVVPPEHLWIQPLPAGEPKEMLSLDTGQERGTFLTLIGWTGD